HMSERPKESVLHLEQNKIFHPFGSITSLPSFTEISQPRWHDPLPIEVPFEFMGVDGTFLLSPTRPSQPPYELIAWAEIGLYSEEEFRRIRSFVIAYEINGLKFFHRLSINSDGRNAENIIDWIRQHGAYSLEPLNSLENGQPTWDIYLPADIARLAKIEAKVIKDELPPFSGSWQKKVKS
ncbi:hypothetical protein HYW87_02215, partial [Candidatus Roizmanbacteria bacterium]|nr:hypothetical protein [Candidatus Roizmanbacteria bacterium]